MTYPLKKIAVLDMKKTKSIIVVIYRHDLVNPSLFSVGCPKNSDKIPKPMVASNIYVISIEFMKNPKLGLYVESANITSDSNKHDILVIMVAP